MSHGKIESCTKHNDGWIRWSEGDKCPLCKLQAELELANTHIGWLKDDKVRLNRSVKIRDNAFDALIDMNEKNEKQLKADLLTAKAENEDLCDNIDAARQDLSDYFDGTLESRLRDENKRLREALDKIVATRFSPSRYQGAVIAEQALKRPDKESNG